MNTMVIVEWFAAATALTSVVLTVRRQILCWPVGIVSVVAYGWFFYSLNLYADATLQVFYAATSVYGWHHWARGGPDHGRALIKVLEPRVRWALVLLLLVLAAAIGEALSRYTDASIPRLDTLASGLSVAAQILLMRKYLESWYIWIAVDVLSIGIYGYKEAWVTSGLYAVFLALATLGLLAWRTSILRRELA